MLNITLKTKSGKIFSAVIKPARFDDYTSEFSISNSWIAEIDGLDGKHDINFIPIFSVSIKRESAEILLPETKGMDKKYKTIAIAIVESIDVLKEHIKKLNEELYAAAQKELENIPDDKIYKLGYCFSYGKSVLIYGMKAAMKKIIEDDIKLADKYDLLKIYPCFDEGFEGEMSWIEIKSAMQKAREIQAEKDAEKAIIDKEKQLEYEKNLKNEIMYFGSKEILSSVGFSVLHSLAANEDNDTISVYSTCYATEMKAENTFDLKDVLKNSGFKWNSEKKQWEIPVSDENRKIVIDFLNKYDKKANPSNFDMVQCWECGRWVKRSKCHVDGGGYYCGC